MEESPMSTRLESRAQVIDVDGRAIEYSEVYEIYRSFIAEQRLEISRIMPADIAAFLAPRIGPRPSREFFAALNGMRPRQRESYVRELMVGFDRRRTQNGVDLDPFTNTFRTVLGIDLEDHCRLPED
jgi:hypothetical protein